MTLPNTNKKTCANCARFSLLGICPQRPALSILPALVEFDEGCPSHIYGLEPPEHSTLDMEEHREVQSMDIQDEVERRELVLIALADMVFRKTPCSSCPAPPSSG